jgi:hypothetical protein
MIRTQMGSSVHGQMVAVNGTLCTIPSRNQQIKRGSGPVRAEAFTEREPLSARWDLPAVTEENHDVYNQDRRSMGPDLNSECLEYEAGVAPLDHEVCR